MVTVIGITKEQQQAIREKKPRKHKEATFQSRCVMFANNYFPETRGLIWCVNNNAPNKIKGAQNRAMGVREGVSDLQMFWKKQFYGFEAKTLTGRQSKPQRAWQKLIESHGGKYYVLNEDIDLFIGILTKIVRP